MTSERHGNASILTDALIGKVEVVDVMELAA